METNQLGFQIVFIKYEHYRFSISTNIEYVWSQGILNFCHYNSYYIDCTNSYMTT